MTTTSRRRFRIGSSALGEREWVDVFLYETPDDLRAAGRNFNGTDHPYTIGLTNAYAGRDGRAGWVLIRLCRGHLSAQVLTHEVHHAATALYGAYVGDRISRRAHLNHFNEPFAHLYSDLAAGLVRALRAAGEIEWPP